LSASNSGGFALATSVANSSGANLILGKARDGTAGSFSTAVQSGDSIGLLRFGGADGSGSLFESARITTAVDSTVSTGIVPGRIVLAPMNASGSTVEAFRVDSSQQLNCQAVNAVIASNRLWRLRSSPVPTLPTAGTAGRTAYASNLRV